MNDKNTKQYAVFIYFLLFTLCTYSVWNLVEELSYQLKVSVVLSVGMFITNTIPMMYAFFFSVLVIFYNSLTFWYSYIKSPENILLVSASSGQSQLCLNPETSNLKPFEIHAIVLFLCVFFLNFIYETSSTTYMNHALWHRCLRSDDLRVGGNRSARGKPTCLTWWPHGNLTCKCKILF